MAQPFKLPDLGEGIHEGEVTSVLVSVGDHVQEGQPILEIETDKAEVEIPSPFTGVVEEIRVKPDDVVKVGSVLVVFGNGAKGEPGENAERRLKPAATDAAGAPAPEPDQAVASRRDGGPVPASPATRRLARELGVDLRLVTGTGRAGLVTAGDVGAFAEGRVRVAENGALVDGRVHVPETPAPADVEPESAQSVTFSIPPLPDFGRWGSVERVPMRSVRRATAKHMAIAWSQIPHASHQELADITRLEKFRREHASEIEAGGGKLSLTVFVLKAAVAALKAFPRVNSSLDAQAEEMVLKRYYHLGVAVDSERGLVVPVIRDVDRKSLTELAVELKQLAERARSGETSLEEMQGGTFTITNIGALGGTGFVPIVNYPQVAILGMGRARLQPVVLGDENDYEIVPRLMLPLVLGFDHRVLDGADVARFVRMVIESLENPDKLWLRI